MKILSFDTSNKTLAVALFDQTGILAQRQLNIKSNHSLTLMPAIDELMKEVSWQPKDLTRIVCAQGPGSYTGIRIAVTTAKMLASTLSIELVGVSSLKLIAGNLPYYDGLLVPVFNARRQNVFCGIYQWEDGNLVNVMEDTHLPMEELLEKLQGKKAMILGDGGDFAELILEKGLEYSKFPHLNLPQGAVLAQLGSTGQPVENIHSFLPIYLKKVEAEEKWLEKTGNSSEHENYVEKI